MNSRVTIALVTMVLAALSAGWTAPREPQPFQEFPGKCIGVHERGSLLGLNRWVIVGMDGKVFRQDRNNVRLVTTLRPAQLATLRKKFLDAGFFSWDKSYCKNPAVPDSMFRELYYADGTRHHRVATADPNTPPKGFDELVKALEVVAR